MQADIQPLQRGIKSQQRQHQHNKGDADAHGCHLLTAEGFQARQPAELLFLGSQRVDHAHVDRAERVHHLPGVRGHGCLDRGDESIDGKRLPLTGGFLKPNAFVSTDALGNPAVSFELQGDGPALIGAVGVSGGSEAQDVDCALAGVAALQG